MSKVFYDWYTMCYSNEPPTCTLEQINMAHSKGYLTDAEYQSVIAIRAPKDEPIDEPITEEPTEETPEAIEEPTAPDEWETKTTF